MTAWQKREQFWGRRLSHKWSSLTFLSQRGFLLMCAELWNVVSNAVTLDIIFWKGCFKGVFFFLTHEPRVRSLKTEHQAGAAKILPSNVSGKQLISDLGWSDRQMCVILTPVTIPSSFHFHPSPWLICIFRLSPTFISDFTTFVLDNVQIEFFKTLFPSIYSSLHP